MLRSYIPNPLPRLYLSTLPFHLLAAEVNYPSLTQLPPHHHLWLITIRNDHTVVYWPYTARMTRLVHQKTIIPSVLGDVICVIVRLAVLVELRLVTDRQTGTRPKHIPR